MLPYIDIYRLLLNILLVVLWYPIILHLVCSTIFSVTLNITDVVLKVVRMVVPLLCIPMLTAFQYLT